MFFVQFLSSSSPMCFFLRFAVWPPPVFPVLRLFPVLVWTLRSTQPVAHRSLRIAETADRGQDGKKPASLIADTTTANAQVRSLSAQAPLIARGNHRGRGRAEGRKVGRPSRCMAESPEAIGFGKRVGSSDGSRAFLDLGRFSTGPELDMLNVQD